ncbi:2-dehydropantoate 2-reductase [Shewanella sp. WXL01]|uniref:2-dehydropantoate 2-reductase n=1 Tax=Shewanella sp. WXL01 TaxID=2709721 RepID=UPI0014386517|nr:2-dehydropantoate 2-reductase [Shewanella sp. WXL01]NKF49859.1 2-dehydropantoate 2-reductase [Shewanella sp. WXL01]
MPQLNSNNNTNPNAASTAQASEPTSPLRIAVFGAGATGCYLAGKLSQAGFNVTVIGRDYTKRLITENGGIGLSHYNGETDRVQVDNVITRASEANELFDIIFITLKCHHLPLVAEDLVAISHQQTCMVFMQNGLGSQQQIAEQLIPRPCVQGITQFNVITKANGVYHQATEGIFLFAKHPQLTAVTTALEQLNSAQTSDDINAIIHGKLLLNLNNAINAISDLPLKTQLEHKPYRKLLASAMQEWLDICAAAKLPIAQLTKVKPTWLPRILRLPDFLFTRVAKQMLDIDPSARSSMWQDIQDGRKTEIEFLNGAVADLGKQHGIATPANAAISRAIGQLEQGQTVSIEAVLVEVRA